MKRISALLDPYRGLPKEIYVIFVAKIINAKKTPNVPLIKSTYLKEIMVIAVISKMPQTILARFWSDNILIKL